jgi:hypothetical protein
MDAIPSQPNGRGPLNKALISTSPEEFRQKWQEHTGVKPIPVPEGKLDDLCPITPIPESFIAWGDVVLLVDNRRLKRFTVQELTSLHSYLEIEADQVDAHTCYLETVDPDQARSMRKWANALLELRRLTKEEINNRLGVLFYQDLGY